MKATTRGYWTRSATVLAAALALIATAVADAHICTGSERAGQSIVRGSTVFNPGVDPREGMQQPLLP